MNIVCATDNDFVQHCTIMLTSLLMNNRNCVIYLLTESLTFKNIRIIKEQVEALGGEFCLCKVDACIIKKLPMPIDSNLSHISRATYYRLLIPEILPSEVDKVLYLDCDIIINGSLLNLWNIDMTGYALAAVPQIGSGHEAERLGYPIKFGYFNAGVNVINMEYWRKNAISKALIDYAVRNFNNIKYHDQDVLNAVLYNKTYHLLPMWNMTSLMYSYFLNRRGDRKNGVIINDYKVEKDNVKRYLNNPIVVHYTSKPKPWQKGCIHPFSYLYYRYALKTNEYSYLKEEAVCVKEWHKFLYCLRCHLSFVKQLMVHTDKTRL